MKRPISAIDMERFNDALKLEGEARELLLKLNERMKAIFGDGRKLSVREMNKLRRAVDRWMRATKLVANVIGEQVPQD